MSTAIKDVRNRDENVILLNAGDIFQGTVWYSEFKWAPMAKFTNILNITAAVGSYNFNIFRRIFSKIIFIFLLFPAF